MTTLSTEQHHTTTTGPPPPSPPDVWRIHAAQERLSTLLVQAATLDIDDASGWAHLRATAHATTTVLRAASLLPPHLHVRHDDPPLVVVRTIAAAHRDHAPALGDPRSPVIPGRR